MPCRRADSLARSPRLAPQHSHAPESLFLVCVSVLCGCKHRARDSGVPGPAAARRREGESGWPTGRVLRGGSWKPPYRIRVRQVLAAAAACSGAPTGLGMSGTAETLETSRVPNRLHCDLVPRGLNPRLREAPPTSVVPQARPESWRLRRALSPCLPLSECHLDAGLPLEIVRWFACFWSPGWTRTNGNMLTRS